MLRNRNHNKPGSAVAIIPVDQFSFAVANYDVHVNQMVHCLANASHFKISLMKDSNNSK